MIKILVCLDFPNHRFTFKVDILGTSHNAMIYFLTEHTVCKYHLTTVYTNFSNNCNRISLNEHV